MPALVVYNGRVHQLNGGQPDTALPGPIGNGEVAVQSAASSPDGRRVAVVATDGPRRRLLIGGAEGAVAPVGPEAPTMTRPSWTPSGSEVWTVLDGKTVARCGLDPAGNARIAPVNAEAADRHWGRSRTCASRATGCASSPSWTAGSTPARWPAASTVTSRSATSAGCGRRTSGRSSRWTGGPAETIVAVSRRMDAPVSQVSVDGLTWHLLPGSNLTPPLRAVAAAPNRPVLVTDQSGVWSFAGGDLESWRQLLGGVPDAVPLYPG